MKKNKPEQINSENNTQKSPKNSQPPYKSILVKKKQETNSEANQTFENENENNQNQNKTPKIQIIDQTNNITLISGQQSLLAPGKNIFNANKNNNNNNSNSNNNSNNNNSKLNLENQVDKNLSKKNSATHSFLAKAAGKNINKMTYLDSLTEYFKQLGTETEESEDEYDYDGLTSSQEIKMDSQNDSYLRLNRNNKRVTLYDLEVLEKHILNEEMKKNNIDKNNNDGQKLKTSKSQNDNKLNKNQGQHNNFLQVQNNYNNSKTNKSNQENQFKTKLKSSEDTSENQNLISQNFQNFSKSIQQSFFKKTNINSDFDTAQRKNQIMELDSNQILDKDHESTREFINTDLNTQKQKIINTFSKHQKFQNKFLKQNPQNSKQNQDLDQINEQNEYNEIDDIKLANSEQYQERKNKSNQQTQQEQHDQQNYIDKDINISQNQNQNIYSQSNINIIKSEDNINQYKYSQNLTKKNSKSENFTHIQQNITDQDMSLQQMQNNQIHKESTNQQLQSIQPSNILKNKKQILANNIQKWRKATIKIVTIKQLSKVISDIRKYGTNMSQDIGLTENFLQKVKKQIISKYKKKKIDQSKYILKHNSKFMGFFYNYFLIFLYVWICITAPWLGFIWSHSEISQGYVILFKIIDMIIFLDIFLQLNLSYIDKEGKTILLRSKIVRKYIFRGLILDLLSCFPFEWFFNQSEILNTSQIRPEYYNQYFKILKLPILYRRARNGKYFLDQVKFSSSSIFRFYRFISNSLLGTHIAGCFYFFVAKLSDPNQNWIDHVDPERQLSEVDYYIFGLYWAIQTLTTVGFGDIMGFTDEERIVSMLWMTFGIGIYSYTLGAISTMIIETDSRMNNLEHGIILLDEFCRETGINMKLKYRIKKALQFNTSKTILSENEKEVFFEELDNRLKSDLSAQIFQNRMESNKRALPFIFSLTDDYNFLSKFIKYLKPLQQKKGEIVYRKGEYPTDLYFITKGRVNFTLFKKNQAFRTFVQGSYFGELEIFSKKKRLYTVVCDTDCEFLTIQSDSYTSILDDFQDIQKKIKHLAEKRAKIFLQNAQEKATKILEAKKKQKEQSKKKFLAELAQEYQKNSNVPFPIQDLKESPVKKYQVSLKEKENEFLMKKNLLPLNSEESQNKLTTLEINSPSNLLQQKINFSAQTSAKQSMSVIDEVEKNTVDLENSEKSIQQNQNKELIQPNTNVTKSQEKQQLLKSPAQNTLQTIKEEDLNQSVVTRPKKNSIASLIDNITENNKNIAENYVKNSDQNESQNIEDNIVSQFSNKLQVSPDLNDMNFSSKYSLFEKRSHFIDFKKPPPSPKKKCSDQIQKSQKNSLQIQDYYHLPAGRKNQNMNLSSSQNNQMNRSSIEIQEISRVSSHSFVEEQKAPDKTQSKYKKISCKLKKFNKKYKKLTHKYKKILKINEKISQELSQHIKNLEKFQQFQELQKDPEFQQLLSDYQQKKQQCFDHNKEKQSSFQFKQEKIQSQNNQQKEKQIAKNKLKLNKSNLKISDFNFPEELNYPKIPLITQDTEFNDFQEILILDQENQQEQVQNDNQNKNSGLQTNYNYLDTQDEVIQGPETIKNKLDLQSYSLSQSPKEEESNKSSENKQISPNSKNYIRQHQQMRLKSDNSPTLTYSTFTPKYHIKQDNFSKFSLLQNQINKKQNLLFTRQKTFENNSSIKNKQTFNLKDNKSNLINPKKEEKNSPFNDSQTQPQPQPQPLPQARKKKKKLTTFSSKVEIFNLESENQEQKLREISQSGQNTTAFILNNNSNLTQQTNIYPFTPKTFNISQLTSLSSEDFNTNSLSKKGQLLGENQNKQYFRFQENLNKNGQNLENNIQFSYQLNEHLEENEENSIDTSQNLNQKNGEQKNLKMENQNKEIFLNSETQSIYSENQEIQLQKNIIENSPKNEKIKEDQNQ